MNNEAMQKLREALSFFMHGRPKEAAGLPRDERYLKYLQNNTPDVQELELQRAYTPEQPIKITVVLCEPKPVKEHVLATAAAIRAQTYGDWQFVLALGAGEAKEYEGIFHEHVRLLIHAGAEQMQLIGDLEDQIDGDYQFLISQGDYLSPDALFQIASALTEEELPCALYTDEDSLWDGVRTEPVLKPNYSQTTMLSYNLIGRPLVVSRDAHIRSGGFKGLSEEAQYDYAMRIAGCAMKMVHLPRVLYTRRVKPRPLTASEGRNTVENELARAQIQGYTIRGKWEGSTRVRVGYKRAPMVSIIVPGPHEFEPLRRFLESVEDVSTHRAYELLPVTTGQENDDTITRYYKALKNNKAARIVISDRGGALPALLNAGAKAAKGSVLLFCSEDLEVKTPDWIESMLDVALLKHIAAVGPKLLYPTGAVAHAGIVIGLGGYYASVYQNLLVQERDDVSKVWINTLRTVSAVTGDCMMIQTPRFLECGGFDERFEHAGYDVEFCLRCNETGYSCAYTPYAQLTTNRERSGPLEGAAKKEKAMVYDVIRTLLEQGDPYYNSNFDYASFAPQIALHPEPALLLNLKLRGVMRE